MSDSFDLPSPSPGREGASLGAVLTLVGIGLALRLAGIVTFGFFVADADLLRHCLFGLGLEIAALALSRKWNGDYTLLLMGIDFALIAVETPRFGEASLLFLFGLIHPFVVLVMTRWSPRVRVLLALLPPLIFAALRFDTGAAPPDSGLLTPAALHHLATANVFLFLAASMTVTLHTLRRLERSWQRAEVVAAARSRLIDDMSHELRTPVAIVLTAAQAALAHDRPVEGYRRSLGRIERQARELGTIISRMLEMSRVERGDVALCLDDDLVQAVTRIVGSFKALADDKAVELRLLAEPVAARTDATVLHMVLGNLLANAIRYSPDGGVVEIRVGGSQKEPTLAVGDHGPGIAAEDLPRVFDRYWRAEKSRTRQKGGAGLGLGLAIAIRYARLLGAKIEVQSILGEGTTFIVRW